MRVRIRPDLATPAKTTRFKKGQSGNPLGRPAGSRHIALQALDTMGEGAAINLMHLVLHEAMFHRDLKAAEIILKRIWPERRGRPVQFKAPPISTAADLPALLNSIMQAMSQGLLTPDEAASISTVAEALRKTIETADIDKRLAAVEAALSTQKDR